jgi:hypothetical protein
VAQGDGTIRTFFKPKNGLDYFQGEVTKDLGSDAAKLIKYWKQKIYAQFVATKVFYIHLMITLIVPHMKFAPVAVLSMGLPIHRKGKHSMLIEVNGLMTVLSLCPKISQRIGMS